MVVLVVGILFYGSIFGVVGAILNVSNTEVGVVSLPPPDPPAKQDAGVDEFAALELELEEIDDDPE